MRYKPVYFTGKQALSVANGFLKAVLESGYIVVACSILPDHVHMVILRHERLAERIIRHLKTRATQQLLADGSHPFAEFQDAQGRTPSVWVQHGWKVFLDSAPRIRRAIRYVENNPLKEGKKKQHWKLVTPFTLELLEETLRKRSR